MDALLVIFAFVLSYSRSFRLPPNLGGEGSESSKPFFFLQFAADPMRGIDFEEGCNEEQQDPFVVNILYVIHIARTSVSSEEWQEKLIG